MTAGECSKLPEDTTRRELSEPLRVAGLFAGIGGIELGLRHAGHTTTLLCEKDPAAIAVLEERFPDIPLHHDVAALSDVGNVDAIAAGFPCQDLSPAGTTKGMSGVKSSLVSHVFRLLERRRVPWVILENVPFMLQLAKGQALDYIVSAFESLGYHWAYRVIDSRAFGLPQRRERVYVVASCVDDPRKVLFAGNDVPVPPTSDSKDVACGFYWTEGNRGLGWAVDAVPTLKSGSAIGIASPPGIWLPSGPIVKPDIRDGERMQGFAADWTRPAVRHQKKEGVRWRLVGNAVTVDVAAWIGQRLRARDGDVTIQGTPVNVGKAWPRAAWNTGDGRRTAVLSTWPVAITGKSLADFLAYPPIPLSERATSGFLSRFVASSLSKPDGFVCALTTHLEAMRDQRGAPAMASSR